MSAPTRRALLGAVPVVAAIGISPSVASQHPDAALLALCAEFEAAQRKYNGIWTWRVARGRTVRGPNCVEDDKERGRLMDELEERPWKIHLRILDVPAQTIDGLRAKARCLLLSHCAMRQIVDDDLEGGEREDLGLDALTSNLLATLLQDLNAGAVTADTCMDGPAAEVAV